MVKDSQEMGFYSVFYFLYVIDQLMFSFQLQASNQRLKAEETFCILSAKG